MPKDFFYFDTTVLVRREADSNTAGRNIHSYNLNRKQFSTNNIKNTYTSDPALPLGIYSTDTSVHKKYTQELIVALETT